MSPEAPVEPTAEERAATQAQLGHLQDYAGGFFAIWTLDLGVRLGLFEALAKHPEGLSAEFLARERELDRLYTEVWCRSAYASGFVEQSSGKYTLAPGLKAPLMEPDSPVYFAGTARFLVALNERLGFVRDHFADGERSWWDGFPPEVGEAVADSSRTFYTRLLRKGLTGVPGLAERLHRPGAVLVEVACGRGQGLLRLSAAYPEATFVGLESDPRALEAGRALLAPHAPRVTVKEGWAEKGPIPEADVVLLNIAFHEIQEKDAALSQVMKALRPGGYVLLSEFPFPDWAEMDQLRTPAGRVMAGIQYMEAILDDQLLPATQVGNWLRKKGFKDVNQLDLAPIHVLVWGRK